MTIYSNISDDMSAKPEPLVVERSFQSPVELVWMAITRPEMISQWFVQMVGFEPKVGTSFTFTGCGCSEKYHHLCEVVEVVPLHKIAYRWRYEGYPGETMVTIELHPEGNKTRLRLVHKGLETLPQELFPKKGFAEGWSWFVGTSLKKMVDSSLPEEFERQFTLTKAVTAPRDLVWTVLTNPHHLVNWWGPKGFTITIEKHEFWVGGVWKQVMQGPDGAKYNNEHIFHEIVPQEKIVLSHGGKKVGGASVRSLATWTLESITANKTLITLRMVFPTVQECEFIVREFKAVEGGKQTLEKMEGYLQTQVVQPV